jgi:hypothetical protein
VIPDGASTLLRVDMNALRSSPHADFARDWTRSAGCLTPEQVSLIFERTETLIAVQWSSGPDAPARSLVVGKGAYTEQDAANAVQLASMLTGAERRAVVEQVRGRYRAFTSDRATAALVGKSLLLLGDAQSVQAALDLADGKPSTTGTSGRLIDGELIARSGVLDDIASSSAVLIATASEQVVKRTGKALGSVGLPRDLTQGTVVIVARLGDSGLRLEGHVARPTAESASQAADTIRSRLGQINLLARFAGLPGVLGNAEVRSDAEVLHVALTASHDDLAVLRERLRDLIADQATCSP